MRMRMESLLAAALEELASIYQRTIDQLFRMGKVAGLHVQRAERRHHNQISVTPMPLNILDQAAVGERLSLRARTHGLCCC
jgi:hypothetical protein